MKCASWLLAARWPGLADLPGAILTRNALRVGPIRPCVSRMAGVTTAGLYFVRFLLSAMVAALPTRPAASTQNGEVT